LRFSEDSASRIRGGELGTFTRGSTAYSSALLDAAFALEKKGQVSDVVKSPEGFHVLKLIEHAPATIRPLREVRERIVQELLGEQRRQKMEELVASLRARARTEVYKEVLAKVRIPDRGEQR
jgi:parvulin-like peptidyl-prolyl isomerase